MESFWNVIITLPHLTCDQMRDVQGDMELYRVLAKHRPIEKTQIVCELTAVKRDV